MQVRMIFEVQIWDEENIYTSRNSVMEIEGFVNFLSGKAPQAKTLLTKQTWIHPQPQISPPGLYKQIAGLRFGRTAYLIVNGKSTRSVKPPAVLRVISFDGIKVHPPLGADRCIISCMQLQGHRRSRISGIMYGVRPAKISAGSSESRH